MRQETTKQLFQYWNRLRAGRPAPRRTDIEPADIKSLLADTLILERDFRSEPIFRLAGTRICAIFGQELKGFSFPSLWAAKDRRVMARLADSAFFNKSVVVVSFEGISQSGRSNPFELLLLPLDGGRDNPRALGAIVAEEKPYWLGADHIREGLITSLRLIDPERDPVFLKNRPAVSVPPLDPAKLEPHPRVPLAPGNLKRIRHLVVIEGGRES
jgi:hypothetical protein